MKLIYKAESIIQRDALLARLHAAGIAAISPPRDVSRKMADGMVDLATDAVTLFFDGFSIFVEDEAEIQARAVLRDFLGEIRSTAVEPRPMKMWEKFQYCALFSMALPGVMSVPAAYYLAKAFKTPERPKWASRLISYFFFIVGWLIALGFVMAMLRPSQLPGAFTSDGY